MSPPSPRRRVRVGGVDIDDLTLAEALDVISELVDAGQGGTVFTPNVDHIVRVEDDARLSTAYASVSVSLVDGAPVRWASGLLGAPLREKVSGSDLILPLMKRSAERRFRVYLLGGEPGVADRAAERLRAATPGLHIVATDSSRIEIGRGPPAHDEVIARVNAARAQLVLVALGCPKQEIFIHEVAPAVRPAVLLGVGAALDFWAGTATRAPAWMSAAGAEWLYRLAHEPRRLWRRYLVRDPRFLLIVLRELLRRRASSAGPDRPCVNP